MDNIGQVVKMPPKELAEYYNAALEFIDPSLTPGSSLEEILNCARERQQELRQRPLSEVREDLNALTEALLFAQNVKRGLIVDSLPEEKITEPVVDESPGDETGEQAAKVKESPLFKDVSDNLNGGTEEIEISKNGKEPTTEEDAVSEAQDDVAEPQAEVENEDTDSEETEPSLENDRAEADSINESKESKPATNETKKPGPVESKDEVGIVEAALTDAEKKTLEARKKTQSGPQPRRRTNSSRPSLREVMHSSPKEDITRARERLTATEQLIHKLKETHPSKLEEIPEQIALPVIKGVFLILWQTAICLGAFWTFSRFFLWAPREVIAGLDSWIVYTAWGLGATLGIGIGIFNWKYRIRTHGISALVQFTAGICALYLLAWWKASKAMPTLSGPSWIYWGVLLAVWLGLSVFSWLRDTHLSRLRERRSSINTNPS